MTTGVGTQRALSLRASVVLTWTRGLMALADTADAGTFNSATVIPPPVATNSDIEVAASSTPDTMTARKIRSIPRERQPSDLVPGERRDLRAISKTACRCGQWNAAAV